MTIGGVPLDKGTFVAACIYLAQRNGDVYRDPDQFLPERFLGVKEDPNAWLPFGGGIRRCIGAAFAEFEMRIALREVLTRCELHKASPAPEKIGRRNITLSPRAGTPVVLTARHPARERELVPA
jgi:cytochrome P450